MVALLCCGCLCACAKVEPWESEDPAEALKVYLAALELQQLEVAWSFLLPRDQAVLASLAASLQEESGVVRPPWEFLRPGHVVSSVREYRDVAQVGAMDEDGRVSVRIELHDGSAIIVPMLRQDGRWYVELPLAGLHPEGGGEATLDAKGSEHE